MFKVLLTAINTWNSWDNSSEIPYLLKEAGCNVDIFCSDDSWLLSNKYYDNWIPIELGNVDLFAEKLIDLANTNEYQWIILTDDIAIDLMNKKIVDEKTFLKIMPIHKIGKRNILSSKNGFSDFCEENGIKTPLSCKYNNSDDFKLISEKLRFPVIVKPNFSWGGTGLSVNNSIDELQSTISKLQAGENLLIQEFISGPTIGVDALFYEGILVHFNCAKMLEHGDSIFSYSTRREYFNTDLFIDTLEQFGTKAGLHGFATITFMFDEKSEHYYLIEVDTRPNSWFVYSRFITENNFSVAIKRIINGDYLKGYKAAINYKPKIEIVLFFKDIKRILIKNDFIGLLKWIFNVKGCWRFLPFYDIKLTKKIIAEIVKLTILGTVIIKIKNKFKSKKVKLSNV
jgi:predicted ATP-grasp superfamily ATP-dependent carboligase